MPKKKPNWVNIVFLTLTPIGAVAGVAWHTMRYGAAASDLAIFAVLFTAVGLAITAGYHRYYAHRTYDCHWALQLFYLTFGAASFENSVLCWASDHRDHHRYVDEEKDPYNIMKGIFWAHIGWIFYEGDPNRGFENLRDFKDDPLVRWQHRWYLPLSAFFGFGLPTLLGWAFGRPLGGFVWGGLLRAVATHHSTFLINSASHFFGKQPYSNEDSSRDNWALAFFTFGEGYHNYHHTFQGDYRNGRSWYHWDPAKWWIASFSTVGLTSRLNRASDWSVLKARMEMDRLSLRPWFERQPQEWRTWWDARLESGRLRVQQAMMQAQVTRKCYQEWLREARSAYRREKRELKVEWAHKIRETRAASREAWLEYNRLLREFRRSAVTVR